MIVDVRVFPSGDLVFGRTDLVVAAGWYLDEFDFVLFSLLVFVQVVELAEESWDEFVVQKLVELVCHGHQLGDAFFGTVQQVLDLKR